jgi:muconolactone delta-isomerase
MKYLVSGCTSSGFSSEEQLAHFLEESVIPSFEYLMKLEKEKKIIVAGLPVGERSFVFIAEAASNEELDEMLRQIPMWPMMDWEVTPLEPLAGREKQEQAYLKEHPTAAQT